jgi:predicted exporter
VSDRSVRRLTLALLAALVIYSLSRLDLTWSITYFLPSRDDARLVDLSLELIDSSLSRRTVLAVGGAPDPRLAAAALADALSSHPEVAWVTHRLDADAVRTLYDLYFERRIYLASDSPEIEIPELLRPDSLADRAERLRLRFARPDSPLVARIAPADPLGLFERSLERLRSAEPSLGILDGRLASRDARHAIVLLGLRSSPFDTRRQAPLLREIQREFARLDAAAGGGLALEQAGVNRIAVAAEQSMRDDANFVSAVATSGVCALFLLVFRSLRHLLVAILAPMGGFIAATAASLTFAAPVHAITLGFGMALVGVADDYPLHLLTQHAASPAGTPAREAVARIRPALLLSGGTTALAFGLLAGSGLPGLGAMGIFAAVGVLVALLLTMVSLPAFLGPGRGASAPQRQLCSLLARWVRWLRLRPLAAAAVPGTFAALAAIGLPQLRWEDDPARLMAGDPALLAEDERVRRLVLDVHPDRFVVAVAPDPEGALALNDRVYTRLRAAVADGHLASVRSLHSVLWSEDLQRRNLAAFRAAPDLEERIDRAFSAHGFRPGAFRAFSQAVASPPAPPLQPEDLLGSVYERALDALTQLREGWAAVTHLRGVESPAAVRTALRGLEGAYYVDHAEIMARLYARYRRSTLWTVALGTCLIFLLLQLRYRSLRRGFLAFLPSVLVALATLGVFGILGLAVNVTSAVSLLVVLGLSADYGIFSVEGTRRPGEVGVTLCALALSCLTTIFAFGTLAYSEHPALHAIGLTTGTGVLLAFLLSPSVHVLATRGAPP